MEDKSPFMKALLDTIHGWKKAGKQGSSSREVWVYQGKFWLLKGNLIFLYTKNMNVENLTLSMG